MGRTPLSAEERKRLRDIMRKKYAVHHTEARARTERREAPAADSEPDTGEPMPWK